MILFYSLDYAIELCSKLFNAHNILTIPLTLVGTILFFPVISVTVRRLHDFNKSGWWILGVLTITACFIWYFYDNQILEEYTDLLAWIWVIGINIPLALIKGTPGSNRFGNEPEYV